MKIITKDEYPRLLGKMWEDAEKECNPIKNKWITIYEGGNKAFKSCMLVNEKGWPVATMRPINSGRLVNYAREE